LLLANLKALGVEKSSIERTVVSHGNSEAGILGRVLPTGMLYFMEGFFPRSNAAAQATGLKLDLAKQPREIAPGIFSTGEIPGAPPEQALLIETSKGLVMLVSCAHPGIAKMVEAAEKQRGVHRIRLLLGGLHMYDWNEKEIRFVVSQLQKLRVESVIPTHCSGALTKRLLLEAYGGRFDTGGAGKQIVLD
jgi:7,8-dihydropterin-6-yl-methyl-4-(beta-D-ribofuranosyl)aminobenzene 5'-phosphate synthase